MKGSAASRKTKTSIGFSLKQGCCFKWSPDGSRIAFHGWRPGYGARSGYFDLYVISSSR